VGLAGLFIWALSSIKEGYGTTAISDLHVGNGVTAPLNALTGGYIINFLNTGASLPQSIAFAQEVIPSTPSSFNAITYSAALPVIFLYGFATWTGTLTAKSPFSHFASETKFVACALFGWLFTFLFPLFIQIVRFINENPLVSPNDTLTGVYGATGLSSAQRGMAAGIIIFTWGVAFDFVALIWFRTVFVANEEFDLGKCDAKAQAYVNDSAYGTGTDAKSPTSASEPGEHTKLNSPTSTVDANQV